MDELPKHLPDPSEIPKPKTEKERFPLNVFANCIGADGFNIMGCPVLVTNKNKKSLLKNNDSSNNNNNNMNDDDDDETTTGENKNRKKSSNQRSSHHGPYGKPMRLSRERLEAFLAMTEERRGETSTNSSRSIMGAISWANGTVLIPVAREGEEYSSSARASNVNTPSNVTSQPRFPAGAASAFSQNNIRKPSSGTALPPPFLFQKATSAISKHLSPVHNNNKDQDGDNSSQVSSPTEHNLGGGGVPTESEFPQKSNITTITDVTGNSAHSSDYDLAEAVAIAAATRGLNPMSAQAAALRAAAIQRREQRLRKRKEQDILAKVIERSERFGLAGLDVPVPVPASTTSMSVNNNNNNTTMMRSRGSTPPPATSHNNNNPSTTTTNQPNQSVISTNQNSLLFKENSQLSNSNNNAAGVAGNNNNNNNTKFSSRSSPITTNTTTANPMSTSSPQHQQQMMMSNKSSSNSNNDQDESNNSERNSNSSSSQKPPSSMPDLQSATTSEHNAMVGLRNKVSTPVSSPSTGKKSQFPPHPSSSGNNNNNASSSPPPPPPAFTSTTAKDRPKGQQQNKFSKNNNNNNAAAASSTTAAATSPNNNNNNKKDAENSTTITVTDNNSQQLPDENDDDDDTLMDESSPNNATPKGKDPTAVGVPQGQGQGLSESDLKRLYKEEQRLMKNKIRLEDYGAKGRGVKSTAIINPGELIWRCRPHLGVLYNDYMKDHCAHCFRPSLEGRSAKSSSNQSSHVCLATTDFLVTCPYCESFSLCNDCGGKPTGLSEVAGTNQQHPSSTVSFLWRRHLDWCKWLRTLSESVRKGDTDYLRFLLEYASRVQSGDVEVVEAISNLCSLEDVQSEEVRHFGDTFSRLVATTFGTKGLTVSQSALREALLRVKCNALGFPFTREATLGWAVHGTVCMLNHSCQPNAALTQSPLGEMEIRSIRPISPGDEITISYVHVPDYPEKAVRRKMLLTQYRFLCRCELCEKQK